jgi:hypothetical protein
MMPVERDDDIPVETKRELMHAATNTGISYWYLCDVFRRGRRAGQRPAWEAGFRLCRSYGDNHAHFDGAQKEAQWLTFLQATEATTSEVFAVDPIDPDRAGRSDAR